jgi:chitinase
MESTCLEPGCLYASGSDPQSCSQEIGVISQTEIEDIIRRTKKKPVLHVDAAVQVLAFDDDQWVAYDDEETLKIKAEYAQSRCLGGVMTWVSQDSREGRLTAALAQAIGKPNSTNTEQDTRRIEARLNRNGPDTVLRHKQCMWSNCGDGKFNSCLSLCL